MAYSKEKIEEVKKQIRRCLVEDSRASSQKIADKLGYDRKFIWRLKKKIHEERAKRFDHYTVNTVLAEYQDEDYELGKMLWDIINDSETSIKEKILAIRELRNGNKELFDKIADAGVFERKLGEIGIEDKSKTLTNLLKDAEPKTKEEFIRAWRGIQGLSNRGGNIPKPSADIDRKGDIPAISKGTKE